MEKKKYNVYLGRFSPLHKGHEAIINSIISKHGSDNLLIMIGSSTSHNKRTPYTYEERAEMIHLVYPEIQVVGLPDAEPNKIFFREDTTGIWLRNIKEIEENMNAEFTFYGGSAEDLAILNREFKTEVIVDRDGGPEKISATMVRDAFDNGDVENAKKMIDEKVYPIAYREYENFRRV